MTFILPELGYGYDALWPSISADIMELHHSKHHQAYVDKLNTVLEQAPEWAERSIEEIVTRIDEAPEGIRQTVRNHGGGHLNHSFFWKCMSPQGGGEPSGELHTALVTKYSSWGAFVDEFNARSLALFGSGWVWLMPDLSIMTTQNQDNPISEGFEMPILGLDVWEHAYYLDYLNKRADYVKNWWKIVDWHFVQGEYDQRQQSRIQA